MGRRLILDTTALIAFERGAIDAAALGDDDLAVAAISLAEYRVGIELADSQERATERSRALDAIETTLSVLEYTATTARHHGRLLAHVRRAGVPRGAHDLVIAAHAVETGRTVLSADSRARFGDLPDVIAVANSSRTST